MIYKFYYYYFFNWCWFWTWITTYKGGKHELWILIMPRELNEFKFLWSYLGLSLVQVTHELKWHWCDTLWNWFDTYVKCGVIIHDPFKFNNYNAYTCSLCKTCVGDENGIMNFGVTFENHIFGKKCTYMFIIF